MDKQFITRYIEKKINYTDEQREVIESIYETLKELECARAFFEVVSEPKLVEVAIHSEDTVRAKYSYLLSEAKRLNIKLDSEYLFKDLRHIS